MRRYDDVDVKCQCAALCFVLEVSGHLRCALVGNPGISSTYVNIDSIPLLMTSGTGST